MSTNFLHPQDQIRQWSFQSFYQWAINVAWLNNKRAFFLAKKKVLAKYPIVLWEPLYPTKAGSYNTWGEPLYPIKK